MVIPKSLSAWVAPPGPSPTGPAGAMLLSPPPGTATFWASLRALTAVGCLASRALFQPPSGPAASGWKYFGGVEQDSEPSRCLPLPPQESPQCLSQPQPSVPLSPTTSSREFGCSSVPATSYCLLGEVSLGALHSDLQGVCSHLQSRKKT